MTPSPLLIRTSRAGDVPEMRAIYADAVARGTSSFELVPPDIAEISRRRDEVLARGLPWLVGERDGQVLGYAYAAPFRPRPAYRFCVENSIYLHADARRRGVARPLLAELIARCEAAGMRQMLAVIGDSANEASIRLHRSLGFDDCGQLTAVGWKFGRWLDVVMMQRRLGPGASRVAMTDTR